LVFIPTFNKISAISWQPVLHCDHFIHCYILLNFV
jgi:hypothetical protein